jgi:uncharacterized protein (TIGR02453 family)
MMPESPFFTPQLFDFLRQLKRRNNRDWFNANKERYENEVRLPALRFIGSFAPRLHKISPHFTADPHPTRGSLFRIYRDTRFSADKKPYKTHAGMSFNHDAGKDVHTPGFYLHLEPEQCFAAGGIWHPDSPTLTKIRSAIVREPERWRAATRKLELVGDSLSRPPRGYDPAHPLIDDLKRKDYIASVSFEDEQVFSPKFMRDFEAACKRMAPLVEFTTLALGMKF